MKRLVWPAVVAGIIVIGIGAYVYSSVFQSVSVQAAKVRRESVRAYVDERGKTRLPVTHRISMPFAGLVERIDLPEGTPVKAGQVVARVATKDLQNELDEAEAVVARLQASITENDDNTVEEVGYLQARQLEESMRRTTEAADERKKSGKERVDFTTKALNRAEELFKDQARSEEDLDRARLDFVESQVNYRTDVLIWQAMQAIEAAIGFLPKMVRDYIDRKKLATAVLEKQKLEAEARLQQTRLRKERSVMASPVDGVVLERKVIDEQYLTGGEELLLIGRLEDLEVEADLLSQDVVQVKVGDKVEIYGPTVGRSMGKGVAGVVDRVHPGGFTKVSSLGVEQQRVKVIIRFADGALSSVLQHKVGVDFRVRVRIFTDSKSNVPAVPRTAVFRGADGGWQVFAIRDGRAIHTPVEVGLMNDEQVEIVEGLAEGDEVVLAPDSAIQDGVRVRGIFRSE